MKGLISFLCALVMCAALARPAAAAPMLYIGHDTGVGYLSPLPGSDAARAAWGAAVAANAEGIDTINFEDATLGAFTSTTVDGTGLAFTNQLLGVAGISNVNPLDATWNTTAGGSQFVFWYTAGSNSTLTFSFVNPTDAFGAYITGLGTDALLSYNFDPGTGALSIPTVGTNAGFSDAQFFGVTDFGHPFSSLTINLASSPAGYIVGVDDVVLATPEPATLSLVGLGLLAMVRRRIARA